MIESAWEFSPQKKCGQLKLASQQELVNEELIFSKELGKTIRSNKLEHNFTHPLILITEKNSLICN